MAVNYDVTFGNISQEEAQRMAHAVCDYDPHDAGDTEPWVTDLVRSLLHAHGGFTVLETGAFQGRTTRELAFALESAGGGLLHYCEIDEARRNAVWARLALDEEYRTPGAVKICPHGDVFQFLQQCQPGSIDVAFVDDDHSKAHVERELALLYPCMRKNGLILLHDVTAACSYIGDMVVRYGGVVLDLPRLGPAGGLGIIQCR